MVGGTRCETKFFYINRSTIGDSSEYRIPQYGSTIAAYSRCSHIIASCTVIGLKSYRDLMQDLSLVYS